MIFVYHTIGQTSKAAAIVSPRHGKSRLN